MSKEKHTAPEKCLEVSSYTGEAYMPLVDYGAWRVAVLRYSDDQSPQEITHFQRHDETDEVFVLLEGQCLLYIGAGNETLEKIHGVVMEPLKLYNVKKGAWHAHTPSADATVLIVENVDTVDENSPLVTLNEAQRMRVQEIAREVYG